MVHKGLKRVWCINEAKGHEVEFKMTMTGGEGSFLDISVGYMNLVVSGSEVKLGGNCHAMKFI